MSYEYTKQEWETYDKTLPTRLQENSVITKRRLDHMEDGIERNSMSLTIGDLVVGDSAVPDASFEVETQLLPILIILVKLLVMKDLYLQLLLKLKLL